MRSSAFLADPDRVLIADASVVIGLNASGHARRIMELTACRILVSDNAVSELAVGALFGHDDGAQLSALIADGVLDRVALKGSAAKIYEALIDGSYGETLDDGEAATIAIAAERGAVALLDERKAQRICRVHFPEVIQGCTAQWLLAAGALGEALHVEAVVNALRRGRMRVPSEFTSAVVTLIGTEEAAKCPSLPRAIRQVGLREDVEDRSRPKY